MPKVSVIIPTYNRQYVIVKTVESVLNQNKVLRLRRAIDGYKFRQKQSEQSCMVKKVKIGSAEGAFINFRHFNILQLTLGAYVRTEGALIYDKDGR